MCLRVVIYSGHEEICFRGHRRVCKGHATIGCAHLLRAFVVRPFPTHSSRDGETHNAMVARGGGGIFNEIPLQSLGESSNSCSNAFVNDR